MESGAETTPCFNSAWDDMSASGGWVSLVFVRFAEQCGNTGFLVGSARIGGNRMPHRGVKYVFER